MGSNWSSICGGVVLALPVLLDAAASHAPPTGGFASVLRALAAEVQKMASAMHLPLVNDLARLGAALMIA